MRKNFIERMDRSFEVRFLQTQPAKARFNASRELVVHYMKIKGVVFISKNDLIASRRAAGRPQDLIDADLLSGE